MCIHFEAKCASRFNLNFSYLMMTDQHFEKILYKINVFTKNIVGIITTFVKEKPYELELGHKLSPKLNSTDWPYCPNLVFHLKRCQKGVNCTLICI